ISTPLFVDLEISTQTDGAQSSQVALPLLEDPYEAIRQAYLVEADTDTPPTCHVEELEDSDTFDARSTSSNFTAPLSPDHPLTHTTPDLFPSLHRTVHIVMCVPLALSPSLSAEEEDDEEDDEIEESSDSNSKSEGTKDEGPTAEDEDPAAEDKDPSAGYEGLAAGDEGLGMRVQSLGLGGDEAVPEGQQQPTLTTWIDLEDGRTYIDVPAYPSPVLPVQTPPSLEWSSGLLPISPASSINPLPISSPMIPLTVPSPAASPSMAETKGFLTKLGAEAEIQGGLIHDHNVQLRELSFALCERSLKHEQERVALTFGEIWRPVLALKSWAGQTDAHSTALWHTISDMQIENRELRLRITEERRARLDLAEIVDSVRRG
nr:hypothetical protein [Tanacetum cinerariifolium]